MESVDRADAGMTGSNIPRNELLVMLHIRVLRTQTALRSVGMHPWERR